MLIGYPERAVNLVKTLRGESLNKQRRSSLEWSRPSLRPFQRKIQRKAFLLLRFVETISRDDFGLGYRPHSETRLRPQKGEIGSQN